MGLPNVGPLEIAIVLVIVLMIFGRKRLPELRGAIGVTAAGPPCASTSTA